MHFNICISIYTYIHATATAALVRGVDQKRFRSRACRIVCPCLVDGSLRLRAEHDRRVSWRPGPKESCVGTGSLWSKSLWEELAAVRLMLALD